MITRMCFWNVCKSSGHIKHFMCGNQTRNQCPSSRVGKHEFWWLSKAWNPDSNDTLTMKHVVFAKNKNMNTWSQECVFGMFANHKDLSDNSSMEANAKPLPFVDFNWFFVTLFIDYSWTIHGFSMYSLNVSWLIRTLPIDSWWILQRFSWNA